VRYSIKLQNFHSFSVRPSDAAQHSMNSPGGRFAMPGIMPDTSSHRNDEPAFEIAAPQQMHFAVRGLRSVAGIIFVVAGAFKLLLLPRFEPVLAALGVPWPSLFAALVPVGEIAGGGVLLAQHHRPRLVRWSGAFLACDMLAAIALVGWRGLRGQPLHVAGFSLGGEPWRLPLELALLLVAVHAAVRPGPADEYLQNEYSQ
jgi:uncharacterized membrane protein YphA (DoxX/SURF4 family)